MFLGALLLSVAGTQVGEVGDEVVAALTAKEEGEGRHDGASGDIAGGDEVGFEPMNQQDASLFFRLVSYRYRRGSTAITTNKSVKDWPGILAGDEALATAILDRLLHKSVVLNVRGRSYRLQDLEKVLK